MCIRVYIQMRLAQSENGRCHDDTKISAGFRIHYHNLKMTKYVQSLRQQVWILRTEKYTLG